MERYRSTLILVVALIVLAGVAIFLNNNNTGGTATPTPTPVVSVWQEPNAVSAIDVVSATSKVSVKKDAKAGTWAITQPISKPADEFAVGGVADSLQNLQAQFVVTTTGDVAQYGLGPSAMAVTVTFSDTQGTKKMFSVGHADLDGSGYYVKTSDSNTVYVVPNTTIEPLRTWLTTPPVETPTPTPLPITAIPETSTPVPTDTPQPAGPVLPAATNTSSPAAAPTAAPTAAPSATP